MDANPLKTSEESDPMQDAVSRRFEAQDRLFRTVLDYAAFDGWSMRALNNAADELGMSPEDGRRFFPNGPSSLLRFFDVWLDRQLLAASPSVDAQPRPARSRLGDLAVRRLEPLLSHHEAARRAVAAKTLPNHIFDTASSFNATIRNFALIPDLDEADAAILDDPLARLALAPVLGAITLYWLEDASSRQADTLRFARQRLTDFRWTRQRLQTTFGLLPPALRRRIV